MSNAGEQLLSELVAMLAEEYSEVVVEQLKFKLSAAMSKYHVTRIDDEEVHPDVTDKIKLYLASKKLEGLSPLTLEGYKLDLTIFSSRVRKKVIDVTSADVRTYLAQCEGNKMSTIGKKLSVLKSFFGWLASEEYIPRDPTTKLKTPKLEKRAPKALTIEELEMIRESCKTRRQRAFVEALYATGCRLSEVQALDRDDINLQTMSTRVIGKGNKEREVYFSFKAMFHIRKYLADRQDDTPALFVSERQPHGRLSRRGIQREIGVIAALAGLQKRVSRTLFVTPLPRSRLTTARSWRLCSNYSDTSLQPRRRYTRNTRRSASANSIKNSSFNKIGDDHETISYCL